MSHDSNRTRIWFPMFSYFESTVDGIIPNEYDTLDEVFANISGWILFAKDCCMLTARRFWVAHNNQFGPLPKKAQLNGLLGGLNLSDLVSSPSSSSAIGKLVEKLEVDVARTIDDDAAVMANNKDTPSKSHKRD